MIPYKRPNLNESAFNCPFCNAFSNQIWFDIYRFRAYQGYFPMPDWKAALCSHGDKVSIWHEDAMIFPNNSSAPPMHTDLPEEIKEDYEEARSIIQKSPRGAAALFRLCVQKLCAHLGEKGKNINEDIGELVKKGLDPKVQKSLDIVRVIGNYSVHPGTIDIRDNPQTATTLAELINIIVDNMITKPKMVDEMYNNLPKIKRDEINKRDGNKTIQ